MSFPANEWRALVADSLRRLADREYQRLAWFGKHAERTSPGEQIRQLVDDYDFEDFIRSPEIYLSGAQEVPAFDLLGRLERYRARRERLNPYKVMNDPEWEAIRADAKRVLSVLFPE